MGQKPGTNAEVDDAVKRYTVISRSLREAMVEIIGEHRQDILTRAKAKLVALGLPVEDDELGANLP